MAYHVLGDSRLADLDAELEPLAVNSRRTPKWIVSRHGADKLTDIIGNRPPSRPSRSTLPSPIQSESFLVPAYDGFGLNENQRFSPIVPESYKNDPEEPVSILETRSLGIPFQDIELMPEREVFQSQLAMRLQRGEKRAKKDKYHAIHDTITSA